MAELTRERLQERCPRCGATPIDTSDGFSAWECGTVRSDGEVYDGPDCLRRQLTAARAETERWQARYEALRAGVERVAQDLHERAHAIALVARSTRDWELYGASDAYYEIERVVQMVRRVLAEPGGGDT